MSTSSIWQLLYKTNSVVCAKIIKDLLFGMFIPSPPNERDDITVSSVITLFYAVFRTSYPDFEKAEFLYCQAFI